MGGVRAVNLLPLWCLSDCRNGWGEVIESRSLDNSKPTSGNRVPGNPTAAASAGIVSCISGYVSKCRLLPLANVGNAPSIISSLLPGYRFSVMPRSFTCSLPNLSCTPSHTEAKNPPRRTASISSSVRSSAIVFSQSFIGKGKRERPRQTPAHRYELCRGVAPSAGGYSRRNFGIWSLTFRTRESRKYAVMLVAPAATSPFFFFARFLRSVRTPRVIPHNHALKSQSLLAARFPVELRPIPFPATHQSGPKARKLEGLRARHTHL